MRWDTWETAPVQSLKLIGNRIDLAGEEALAISPDGVEPVWDGANNRD